VAASSDFWKNGPRRAGGEPGQRISRLGFDGRGTMAFVIQLHVALACFVWIAALWSNSAAALPSVSRSGSLVDFEEPTATAAGAKQGVLASSHAQTST
jgi:hypothetical protein